MRLLVTGASGFVGRWAVDALLARGHQVFAASQRGFSRSVEHPNLYVLPTWDLGDGSEAPYEDLKLDAILHLAAKVHAPSAAAEEFDRVNVQGTEALLRFAVRAGAKRFVFLSTIGVHGPARYLRREMVAETAPLRPENAYSESKLRAERMLVHFCNAARLRYTVVRAPLVYGPGAPGNVQVLESLLRKKVPIPVTSSPNSRSFVYIGNLVDFLSVCMEDRRHENRTLLVADDEVISTEDLVFYLAEQNQVKARIMRLPRGILKAVGTLTGKSRQLEQLAGDLVVSNAQAKQELGWEPPFRGLQEILNAEKVQ